MSETQETPQDVKRDGGVPINFDSRELILYYDNAAMWDLQEVTGKRVGDVAMELQKETLDCKLFCQVLHFGLRRAHPEYTMEKLGELRITADEYIVLRWWLVKAMMGSYIDEKELNELGEISKKAARAEAAVVIEVMKTQKAILETKLLEVEKQRKKIKPEIVSLPNGDEPPSTILTSLRGSSGDLQQKTSTIEHTVSLNVDGGEILE